MFRMVVIIAIQSSRCVTYNNEIQNLCRWNVDRNRTHWITSTCCCVQAVLTYRNSSLFHFQTSYLVMQVFRLMYGLEHT